MQPRDYPIRWKPGFGWGWRGFFRLLFPVDRFIPGYDVLPVCGSRGWFRLANWLRRLNWAIRGPV